MGKENKTVYAILGFLNHEDLTGYEIKKILNKLGHATAFSRCPKINP